MPSLGQIIPRKSMMLSTISQAGPKIPNKVHPTSNVSFSSKTITQERFKKDLAVDVGCGTGQVTKELSGHFHKVIGKSLHPLIARHCTSL